MTEHLLLNRCAKFFIAGHRGMVGSAIWREAERQGFSNLIGKNSTDLDLRDREAVFEFFAHERPQYVVLAAAKVGGILANKSFPTDFLSQNLQIQVNVMDAALHHGVDRLLFMGSACIYPKFAAQPIAEDSLLTGHLEETNDAYAIAKIAGIKHVQSARSQYGKQWISIMPTNLYGPGDTYSEVSSHVLPAMIMRFENALRSGERVITNWGSGGATREFLYVDDLAKASLFLMENYDGNRQVNVGSGEEISIRELSELISKTVGFDGEVVWDTSKPDGTPRRLLDCSTIGSLGWRAATSLENGLQKTIKDYREKF